VPQPAGARGTKGGVIGAGGRGDPPAVFRSSRFLPALLSGLVMGSAFVVAACDAGPTELATLRIDPTPIPTPKLPTTGDIAMQAFIDRLATGKLSYHAALHGEMVGAISGVKVDGAIDVAGDNYAEDISWLFVQPPSVPVSVRVVGTQRWLRLDRGRWEKISASMPSNSPFAALDTAEDFKLLRTEHVGGKDMHHVHLDGGGLIVAPDLMPAGNVTNEKVDKVDFELVIDEKGEPVSATWRLDGEARVSGQLQGIRIDLDILFSKVGSKIVVKAP
jgi:hypothetical protein